MVSVAQLVEPRIVIPVVVGSSPIVHPRMLMSTLAPLLRGVSSQVSRADLTVCDSLCGCDVRFMLSLVVLTKVKVNKAVRKLEYIVNSRKV